MPNVYTLTTDFGSGEYVGAMKGVLLSMDPGATIVDIDHGIRPHDIRHGAYVLYAAAPYFPFAAHLGVVDPSVGTPRRALVLVAERALFIGPDNGLLIPAARRMGLKEVRAITNLSLALPDISDTFHGRDLFAPVAARLLTGTKPAEVGPVVRDFVDLSFGEPRPVPGGFQAEVITYDRFGNVITNVPRAAVLRTWSVGDPLEITLGGYELRAPLVRTYGEVSPGDFLVTISSSGFLEIAKRQGNAASALGAEPGSPLTLRRS